MTTPARAPELIAARSTFTVEDRPNPTKASDPPAAPRSGRVLVQQRPTLAPTGDVLAARTAAASAVMALPLTPAQQQARLEELSHASPQVLEALFASAPTPHRPPDGHAVGVHVYPPGATADLPWLVEFAAKHLWQEKVFDATARTVVDRLGAFGVPLVNGTKATLRIGSLDESMTRAFGPSATPYGDGRASLITDYTTARNWPVAVKWIDEFREIEPGIWLGRSFYGKDFWAHVLLRFEP